MKLDLHSIMLSPRTGILFLIRFDSEQEQDKAVLSIGSNLSEQVCLLDLLKNYPQNRSDICVISTTRLAIWYSKQKRMSG